MNGFYWLVEHEIAGSPQPCPDADLDGWRDAGIRAVVSLVEERLDFDGFETVHLPVPDMTAPTLEQLQSACAFINRARSAGTPIVVHCLGGKGRTGTVLAAWLIAQGMPVEAAIARVRALAPGSIETPEQESALFAFASAAD